MQYMFIYQFIYIFIDVEDYMQVINEKEDQISILKEECESLKKCVVQPILKVNDRYVIIENESI